MRRMASDAVDDSVAAKMSWNLRRVCAQHEQHAMREVEYTKRSPNQRKAARDKRVECTRYQRTDQDRTHQAALPK